MHPRDLELIAGTHGCGIQILDVSTLQQFTSDALAKPAQLFKPTVALQYGERPVGSEPRSQRMWRAERSPSGAVITYRLAVPLSGGAPRVTVLNAGGDTVARMMGTNTAGLSQVTWNMMATGTQVVPQGGGGGRGGGFGFGAQPTGPVNDPGFPSGFNSRPAESRGAPDTSGSPSNQPRVLAQAATNAPTGGRGGGGGGGFGGFGGARVLPVETGDYRVVIDAGGQMMSQTLRVVRVAPDETSVLVPAKR